jgi:hypothetical protein
MNIPKDVQDKLDKDHEIFMESLKRFDSNNGYPSLVKSLAKSLYLRKECIIARFLEAMEWRDRKLKILSKRHRVKWSRKE